MHHILLAAQPTALLTEVPTPDQPLGQGVISTLAYFVLSMTIFGIGFIVQDLLTPGKFRKQVFVDNLPNACVLAGSQAIAIGIVLAAAISTSPTDLVAGLIATAVYGTVGLVLQTIFLMVEPGKIPLRGRRHQITAISAAQRHHSHRRGSH